MDGRFDVILRQRPTPDEPVSIDSLYFPADRKRARATDRSQARTGSPQRRQPSEAKRSRGRDQLALPGDALVPAAFCAP